MGGEENLQGGSWAVCLSRGSHLSAEASVTAILSPYTLYCRGLPVHALGFGELYCLDIFV